MSVNVQWGMCLTTQNLRNTRIRDRGLLNASWTAANRLGA